MDRIRCGAIVSGVIGVVLLAAGGTALAQGTTGRVVGRAVDQDSGAPMAGVTVIAQGPQGEDATITDDKGQYFFTTLPIGTYTLRFYVANTSTQVEQPGVVVSAEKTVRVNVKIASTAQAAAQGTYVITGKAPIIDVGSARIGSTFDEDYARNVPNDRTYGDIIQKAPGAFLDASGNVSIGGATGLENIYIVNGMNVTGLELGNLANPTAAAQVNGGTNLPLEFLTQVDVNAGGYQAEFGGALGGVINTQLKSGTNELHGSAFGYWSPYWLAGTPKTVLSTSALARQDKPDFDDTIGVEVGGPILKDKLFFWVGFAPRIIDNHTFRNAYHETLLTDPMTGAPILDANGLGQAATDASGNPILTQDPSWRARINGSRRIYSVAGTLDFTPRPEHRLKLTAITTPSFNRLVRDVNANPTWSQESLTNTNTDISAHWTSSLFDKHWQIEALAGLHNEYFNDRSPFGELNSRNELDYYTSDLFTLEGAPQCAPIQYNDGNGNPQQFFPCPAGNPVYHGGGFGLARKFTGNRWTGEIKSSHIFEAGGRHEIKYGWHMDYATFNQDRYYSGPIGARAIIIVPNGGPPDFTPSPQHVNSLTFFRLQPGQYPIDFGPDPTMFRFPQSDLVNYPVYQDHIQAYVKNLSHAFFLQESFSPAQLRNLSINLGLRYEVQKLYDMTGYAFLDTRNLGPRIGVVYDPLNDGRSKISASYGRYFEAIPMSIAARYFGGENFVYRNGIPTSTCANPDPYSWTGAAEFKSCGTLPAQGVFTGDVASGYNPINNSALAQTHLQGQFQNEIVASLERELTQDMALSVNYIHRWLGTIVEDGYDDFNFTDVLANPGNVPQQALDDANRQAQDLRAQANAAAVKAATTMDPNDRAAAAVLASQASTAETKASTLKTLAGAPKPERTYDAITLALNKRFSKNWFARASYTYSRLVGNYEGLFQVQQSYFAPNGSNAYDTSDLYVNSRGRLPNDRPHLARVDGYYQLPVGKGQVTLGLSFVGQSGMPRNYYAQLISGNQLVFLLPRGAGGRTPPVTQFDGHIAYGRELAPKVALEAFINLFNLFNQQATLLTDDNYTFDVAAPIQNGTPSDLKFAKNAFGQPLPKNINYGHALSYQAPFHGQLGLRLTF